MERDKYRQEYDSFNHKTYFVNQTTHEIMYEGQNITVASNTRYLDGTPKIIRDFTICGFTIAEKGHTKISRDDDGQAFEGVYCYMTDNYGGSDIELHLSKVVSCEYQTSPITTYGKFLYLLIR